MNESDKFVRYALGYAARGWHVLPLTPKNKTPFGRLVPHGVKDATLDEYQIKKWFKKHLCNIGVATGEKSKIWVLDIDGPVGAVVWWEWESRYGPAFTLAQRTGRIDGGRQLFFQYPEGYLIKTRANIMSGIDVRGENGYIVAPPSIHSSGKSYIWEGKVPINPAPPKLLELVARKNHPTSPGKAAKPRTAHNSSGSNYGQVVTDELLKELAFCARGGRDQTGYRVAVRLLELEASGDVAPGTTEKTLRAGFARCGYLEDKRHERGERGLQRILNSARKRVQ